MKLRAAIQDHLREELSDPNGLLIVQEDGPEWKGLQDIRLSYSHSCDFALLAWTSTHRIGVDLERVDREYSHSPLELARRFFHETEVRTLEGLLQNPAGISSAFLDLWLKKEAHAKLTRHGLKGSIHIPVDSIPDVSFEVIPVIPKGYDARVAIR